MHSSHKLLLVFLVTLVLSGVLFWLGLQDLKKNLTLPTNLAKISKDATNQTDPLVSDFKEATPSASSLQNQAQAIVTRVVDGDTIEVELNGEQKKLRYIGINTPETVAPNKKVECFGKEASNENKNLLEGKKVYLEKDISETDKYGRLLRYIYLPTGNGDFLFVNDYLVREGFAQVSTYPPDVKYQSRFLEAQQEAKSWNKGLWNKCKS